MTAKSKIEEMAREITTEAFQKADPLRSAPTITEHACELMAKRILAECEVRVNELRPCSVMNSDNEMWIRGMDDLLAHLKSLFGEGERR